MFYVKSVISEFGSSQMKYLLDSGAQPNKAPTNNRNRFQRLIFRFSMQRRWDINISPNVYLNNRLRVDIIVVALCAWPPGTTLLTCCLPCRRHGNLKKPKPFGLLTQRSVSLKKFCLCLFQESNADMNSVLLLLNERVFFFGKFYDARERYILIGSFVASCFFSFGGRRKGTN